ncbi:MAG: multidrug efflux RND transporter permease subunit [Rhodospirillales bacterium]
MTLSSFFIERPIFATVISIVIIIVGALSYFSLPVAQYPEIAPPTIVVSASYPGADAETVANTVATPIEQELNGVENMLYMFSQSTSTGQMRLTITFALGTNLDDAQVLVQNRVATAEPRVPEEVRRLGIVTQKSSPDLMMVIHLRSPDESLDQLYISNYGLLQIRDVLQRVDGVGQIQMFGARDYSMRVWLDPDRIAALGMTAGEVVEAVRGQNVQVAGGILGQPPTPQASAFHTGIVLQGRLEEVEQFEQIVVKATSDGNIVRLADVARIELGAQEYTTNSYLNGKPAVALAIFQRPGSNALETADRLLATIEELSKDFPDGLAYEVVYNPTEFIGESITELIKTIFEAVALVVLVVLVFLQTWRASIIPIVAIPVSLIGTFAVMLLFGFSINNLTLFGLVLAVGIVVDDAIVVVENVERNLAQGLSPREAAHKSMKEVGGAIIAISLVLVAVFVPTAFIGGISGQFYSQFALTIAVATILSAFCSLTLSPALSAILLRPHGAAGGGSRWNPISLFFRAFNRAFDALGRGYSALVGWVIRLGFIMLTLYAGLIALTAWAFMQVPTGFIPNQDQGYVITVVQLPPGASLSRTDAVMKKVEGILQDTPGVKNTVVFAGFSGATFTNASNAGVIFSALEPFPQRAAAGLSADAIIASTYPRMAPVVEAFVITIAPPPVRGIGNAGGFKMMVQDRRNRGPEALAAAANAMAAAANADPRLVGVFTPFQIGTPKLFVDLDRARAEMLNVDVASVFETLEVYLGSSFVNDFNLFGRTYRVTAQADGAYRLYEADIARLRTQSSSGASVPLGSLVTFDYESGPDRVPRYNLYPAAEVQGSALPGVSTGESLAILQNLAANVLPFGFDFEWTELSYQAAQASGAEFFIFPLCVLFVFLLLAAQYESWSLPLAVVLIVPMCLLSAVAGLAWFGLANDILAQIGFVVLVGLASKNAILIVEFARQLEDQGRDRFEAAVEACRLRLRPILMTSFAFILGVVPLVIASGAGAEMRQVLGTTVFFGMLGVTFFGLIFTPVFYVLLRGLVERLQRPKAGKAAAVAEES